MNTGPDAFSTEGEPRSEIEDVLNWFLINIHRSYCTLHLVTG